MSVDSSFIETLGSRVVDSGRSRGISRDDVWQAADALLIAGQRPTIERIRQHLGRGSPNTVSPHLDAWFAGLGARLADPRAFAPPAQVPEPVAQAARYLWDAAQAEARAAASADYAARDAAVIQREVAAQKAQDALQGERQMLDVRLEAAAHAMGELSRARDGALERAARAEAALDTLRGDLAALRAEAASVLAAERDRAAALLKDMAGKRDVERVEWDKERSLSSERANAAERRLALEVDAARTGAREVRQRLDEERAGFRAQLTEAQALTAKHADDAAAAVMRASVLQERLQQMEHRIAAQDAAARAAAERVREARAGEETRLARGAAPGTAGREAAGGRANLSARGIDVPPKKRQIRRAPSSLAGAIRPTRKIRGG